MGNTNPTYGTILVIFDNVCQNPTTRLISNCRRQRRYHQMKQQTTSTRSRAATTNEHKIAKVLWWWKCWQQMPHIFSEVWEANDQYICACTLHWYYIYLFLQGNITIQTCICAFSIDENITNFGYPSKFSSLCSPHEEHKKIPGIVWSLRILCLEIMIVDTAVTSFGCAWQK